MTNTERLAFEAVELAEDAMAYVPEYFVNKHGMNRRMAALKEALAAHDAEQAAQAVPAGFVPAFVLRNVLATLEHENTSGSAIQDTIWHSPGETLFDYIENSLEQFDATAAPAPEAQDSARTSPAHQPVHGWTDADADAARLALELECLLTDGDVPMPVTSRWWESAHEALALHRQRLESELSETRANVDKAPAAQSATVEEWERELSAVMPLDFKDWWQNDRHEWPAVAAAVIRSQRADCELGWKMAAEAAPSAEPLTDEQIAEGRYRMWADELEEAPEPWAFLKGARWAERYYGIGGATTGEQR